MDCYTQFCVGTIIFHVAFNILIAREQTSQWSSHIYVQGIGGVCTHLCTEIQFSGYQIWGYIFGKYKFSVIPLHIYHIICLLHHKMRGNPLAWCLHFHWSDGQNNLKYKISLPRQIGKFQIYYICWRVFRDIRVKFFFLFLYIFKISSSVNFSGSSVSVPGSWTALRWSSGCCFSYWFPFKCDAW